MASFATSYIKTEAAQVTRSADFASMTGTNFSSWYRQDEGTLYTESSASGVAVLQRIGFAVSDGTSNNRITSVINSGTSIRTLINAGGLGQADMTLTVASAFGVFNKNVVAYKVNDFAATVNGASVQTDNLGTVPVVDRAWFGTQENSPGGLSLNGTIKKIAYYPARLTNANLQALTS